MQNKLNYTKQILDKFYNPLYVGVVDNYNARGFAGSLACGDAVELTLFIDKDVVTEAKYRVFGCPGAIAASEVMIELILLDFLVFD